MTILQAQAMDDLKIIAHIRIKKDNLILGFLKARRTYITAYFYENCPKITNQREHANRFAACAHLLTQATVLLKLPTNQAIHTSDSRGGERNPPAKSKHLTEPRTHNRYLTPRCFFTHNKMPNWLEAEKSFTMANGTQIIAGKQYKLLATDIADNKNQQTCQVFLEDPAGAIVKLPLKTICSNFLQGHLPSATFQK